MTDMKLLEVRFHGGPAAVTVGKITYTQGRAYFQYDSEFLASGLDLSPFSLQRIPELQEARAEPFSGLQGVFADSLPDGWGLLIMDRALKKHGVDLSGVNPVDRLAFVGDRAMGALSYHPDEGAGFFDNSRAVNSGAGIDINRMAEESIKLYTGEVDDVLDELVDSSVSPGGARPKALIGLSDDRQAISGAHDLPDGYEHWLVKFPPGNTPEHRAEGAIEFLFAEMARKAGIDVPPTRLIESAHPGYAYFLTRRFDRVGTHKRVHMHTLAGLIHANFRVADCDYITLLKVCQRLTGSHEQVTDLFRRMVFNVMAGNRDDHTKNFSFLMREDGQWHNSPAYDLTYNRGMAGWHSLAVGSAGKGVTLGNLLEVAKVFSIQKKKVMAIADEVSAAMDIWRFEAPHHAIPATLYQEILQHIELQRSLIFPGV